VEETQLYGRYMVLNLTTDRMLSISWLGRAYTKKASEAKFSGFSRSFDFLININFF